MALIDNGVYVHGRRVETPKNLDETYRLLDAAGGIAWIGLYRPSPEEVASVAREFDLHPLAVEDALSGHQRSKVERYGDTLFAVLHHPEREHNSCRASLSDPASDCFVHGDSPIKVT
ncbi:CorA family divalent cation transporter [Microbacterium sp. DWRC1-3]|uniref:CorA family divalent cation transporter n=1 Tax=Microbacterium sp. DWRC1-3 TaxID=2804630 RepID=UPI003CE9981A